MKISICHETRYCYDNPTKHSIQLLRVTPLTMGHQKVLSWKLVLPRFGSEIFDGFGNYCTLLSLHVPHQNLLIQATGDVEIDETMEFFDDNRLPPILFLRETELTRCTGQIRALAQRHMRGGINRENLVAFAADILARMPYTKNSTNVATTAAEAFMMGKGVCQDHTHVFLAGARAMGVPARYVSGYLLTEAESHVASHAWAEAWIDGHWYVFDISNQLFTPSRHVQVAVGLDYGTAAPVRGIRVGGGHERMAFNVQVMGDQ